MQFSTVAILALAATASAWSNETVAYTTEVHTAYTTVCPEATSLTFNGVTYTVTAVRQPCILRQSWVGDEKRGSQWGAPV